MSEELYKKYRPRTLKGVIGQPDAVKVLTGYLASGNVPHTILFSGNSGCGKTTLARILTDKLGCDDMDFSEINAADTRGIDTVREIKQQMQARPLAGPCRVYLMDECQKLTSDSQSAMLKILEDTPKHVYFMLATTHPEKILTAVRNRCTEIKLRSLKPAEVRQLLDKVCGKESLTVSDEVLSAIVEASEGSARKSLVLLDKVAQLSDDADRLAAIVGDDVSTTPAFAIVQEILYKNGKPSWPAVAKILDGLGNDQEWEGLRHMVLTCAAKHLIKTGSAKAANVIQAFQYNYFDSKRAGFVLSCYTAVNS
jgi:DNA polymerase III gamma/tau subunit